MQSLQKYHVEELEKTEKQHAVKYHQLRDLLGDQKIQLTLQSLQRARANSKPGTALTAKITEASLQKTLSPEDPANALAGTYPTQQSQLMRQKLYQSSFELSHLDTSRINQQKEAHRKQQQQLLD